MLNQRLQQKLLQKLSPQQILLMKLLQIPTVALDQRIKQEIEENPALDELTNENEFDEDDSYQENSDQEGSDDFNEYDEEKPDHDRDNDEFDLNDYIDDDEIPSYRLNAQNTSPDDERREIPFVSGKTFHELLIDQLGMRDLDDKQYSIALTIIGNLDDSGYLQRDIDAMVDDLAFSQNITATVQEIEEVLDVIQEFDPPGVGARNLQECLVLQLRKKEETPPVELAITILQRFFNEFTKKALRQDY